MILFCCCWKHLNLQTWTSNFRNRAYKYKWTGKCLLLKKGASVSSKAFFISFHLISQFDLLLILSNHIEHSETFCIKQYVNSYKIRSHRKSRFAHKKVWKYRYSTLHTNFHLYAQFVICYCLWGFYQWLWQYSVPFLCLIWFWKTVERYKIF